MGNQTSSLQEYKLQEAYRIENIMKEKRFQFAFRCLDDIMKINPKENIVFSPSCIYKALLIIYIMVKDDIEKRLQNILLLTEISKQDLINYSDFTTISTIASVDHINIPHYSQDVRCFIKPNIRLHQQSFPFMFSSVSNLNLFENSECLINYINNKVLKKAVNDYFCDTSSLTVVKQDTEFVLMTSITGRFKKFQDSAAAAVDSPDVESLIDAQKISYFYENLSMYVNEYFYEHRNISLFVLRPASLISGKCRISNYKNSRSNIRVLVEQLLTSDGFSELHKVLDRSAPLLGEVETLLTEHNLLPKFEVEKDLTMRELLQGLGAEQLLMPDAIFMDPSTVKGILPVVCFGNVMHRSQVKVTQKDISASAITLIHSGLETSSGIEIDQNDFGHPFIWLIYDKFRREILFIGAFNKFTSAASCSR
ncbi:serine protease inhibitor 88Ea-like [Nylanderia fulva]|uniref:serine protease inhibitor 88Ea-like n=1 Tax=Nylanderia fulva TaxID=613905 RepID=UPI0010FB804F|nr:serine protease inhibitor 88Ea-like [Nylanderia fulva]